MTRRVPMGARRSSKRNGTTLWVAFQSTLGLVSTNTIAFDLVSGSDWERGSTALETANILRIRGYCHVVSEVIDSQWAAYIAIVDEDETTASLDPLNIGTYTDEKILWTAGYLGGGVVAPEGLHIPIDVKSNRKLTSGQSIIFAERADTTDSFISGYLTRSLLRVAG